jgi:hypothetical protein
MVTFYHFDVMGIMISEEDFHTEKLGKIYYSVYEYRCRSLVIGGQAFYADIRKSLGAYFLNRST